MGLNWRALTLSDYLEALEAHNEAHGGKKAERVVDPEREKMLAGVMAARMGD